MIFSSLLFSNIHLFSILISKRHRSKVQGPALSCYHLADGSARTERHGNRRGWSDAWSCDHADRHDRYTEKSHCHKTRSDMADMIVTKSASHASRNINFLRPWLWAQMLYFSAKANFYEFANILVWFYYPFFSVALDSPYSCVSCEHNVVLLLWPSSWAPSCEVHLGVVHSFDCVAEFQTRSLSAIMEMMRWFAGDQIRNVAVSTLLFACLHVNS